MTKKQVYTTIIKEVIYNYKLVWLSTIIAFLLSLWTLLPDFYIKTALPSEYNQVVNVIVHSLSLSYIAGSLFFVFSVIIPTIQSRFIILPHLSDKLAELREALGDFMAVSCTNEDYSTDFDLKSFVERVIREDCKPYCERNSLSVEEFGYNVHFKPEYLIALSLSLQKLDEILFDIQAMASWLSPENHRVLSAIKHDSFISLLRGRCAGYMKTSFSTEDLNIRFGILKKSLLDYDRSRESLNELVNKYDRYHISEKTTSLPLKLKHLNQ
ncbi:MAG: hypothetical protein J5616_08695 [Bacteroidaceae bacterium]|nr:hypothetical protein [Bacteroidaceae bacterium]